MSPITLTAYAARRGVTKMAVSRAVARGILRDSVVRDARGVPAIADPELADREWAQNTDYTKAPQRAPGAAPAPALPPPPAPEPEDEPEPSPPRAGPTPAPKPGEESLANAAARQKHWAAELAQLKFREAAGELVPAADVERRLVNVFAASKTHLLAIPSRLQQALPHLTASDLEVLDGILREALVELAEVP